MKSVNIECPYCGKVFPVIFAKENEKGKEYDRIKKAEDSGMEILDFEIREPQEVYPNQVDDTVEYLKIDMDINSEIKRFYLYRIEPKEYEFVYSLKGEGQNYRMKTKNFYFNEENRVYMPAWGITEDHSNRHKFDKEESEKLVKKTGFELDYRTQEKVYILKINDKIEQLIVNDKLNKDLIFKLVKAWFGCCIT